VSASHHPTPTTFSQCAHASETANASRLIDDPWIERAAVLVFSFLYVARPPLSAAGSCCKAFARSMTATVVYGCLTCSLGLWQPGTTTVPSWGRSACLPSLLPPPPSTPHLTCKLQDISPLGTVGSRVLVHCPSLLSLTLFCLPPPRPLPTQGSATCVDGAAAACGLQGNQPTGGAK
jgi:hypothetical protein